MKTSALPAIVAALVGLAAGAAQAQVIATTSTNVYLRAGPAAEYPAVGLMPQGLEVSVQGCLADYTWCDVSAVGYGRGWAHASLLNQPFGGGNAPLAEVAPRLGIGVVGFALLDYWLDHYRDKPFYAERRRWAERWRSTHPGQPAPVVPGVPRVQPRAPDQSGPGG